MHITLRFRELVRHFLMRFYDNDLLSPDQDQLPGLAGLFGVLAAPGVVLPLWLMNKYFMMTLAAGDVPLYLRDLASTMEKFLFVGFAMTAVGAVTVLEWDALFPDRRDYLVLCPLPVRMRDIFAAKICALAVLIGCLLAATMSLTPVLFPAVVLGNAPVGNVLCFAACHVAATAAACLFAFLAVVGLQGLFLNILPYRVFTRISPWLQLACLAGLLVQFLAASEAIGHLNHAAARNHWTVYVSPPLWFLGIYQYGVGWDKPVIRELARTGALALAGAAVLAAGTYLLAYKRHLKRCLEAPAIQAAAPGPFRRLLSMLVDAAAARRPLERGVFRFITATLGRSRKQRLYFGVYAALAVVAASQPLATVLTTPDHAWLYRPNRLMVWIPYVLLLIVVPGLRHTFEIPAEHKANWVFRMAESEHGRILGGIRAAMLMLGVLPVCGGLLPFYLWLWGPRNALLHTAVVTAVALLAGELLLLGFNKIPFTCSYVSGRVNVIPWALYILLFLTLVLWLGSLELWILRRPWGVSIPLAVLAAAVAVRKRQVRCETEPPHFDDQPDPVVRELKLAF